MAHKVLIIGCGAIAGGYDADRSPEDWPLSHAGAIARDDRFELVACVDPDDAAREAFAARWGVAKAAPSFDALSARPSEFDLVIVSSPTPFHAEHLETVLTIKPRIVICEKPLAADLAEAERLVERYNDAGIPLVVNYVRRWSYAFQAVESGRSDLGSDDLISAVGTYAKGIVHNGSHMVDALQMMLGPLALHSVGPARLDFWSDDPSVSAILTTDEGVPVHLVAGHAGAFTQFEIVITYAKVEIAIRDGGSRWEYRMVTDSSQYPGHRVLGEADWNGEDAMKTAMQSLFMDTAQFLEDGQTADLASNAAEALSAQRLCEEIRAKALETIRKDPE